MIDIQTNPGRDQEERYMVSLNKLIHDNCNVKYEQ